MQNARVHILMQYTVYVFRRPKSEEFVSPT
jgi:hypothetical protein